MTIQEALEYFIVSQQLKGSTDKTISNYKQMIGQFERYLQSQGIEDIENVDVLSFNKYHLYLRGTKICQRSIKTYLGHIRTFMAACYKDELITADVSKKMILPRTEKPAIEILSKEEIECLVTCCSKKSELGLRDIAIIFLMVDCGLRAEEVSRLKISDVNFDGRYLNVFGKGQKGRIIPMGLATAKILIKYSSKRTFSGSEYFILSKNGGKLRPDSITRLFSRLKKRSGIARVHAHLLRHTFATNFLLYGLGDIYELSRILGHSDTKITEVYLHIASYYQILEKQRKRKPTFMDLLI